MLSVMECKTCMALVHIYFSKCCKMAVKVQICQFQHVYDIKYSVINKTNIILEKQNDKKMALYIYLSLLIFLEATDHVVDSLSGQQGQQSVLSNSQDNYRSI